MKSPEDIKSFEIFTNKIFERVKTEYLDMLDFEVDRDFFGKIGSLKDIYKVKDPINDPYPWQVGFENKSILTLKQLMHDLQLYCSGLNESESFLSSTIESWKSYLNDHMKLEEELDDNKKKWQQDLIERYLRGNVPIRFPADGGDPTGASIEKYYEFVFLPLYRLGNIIFEVLSDRHPRIAKRFGIVGRATATSVINFLEKELADVKRYNTDSQIDNSILKIQWFKPGSINDLEKLFNYMYRKKWIRIKEREKFFKHFQMVDSEYDTLTIPDRELVEDFSPIKWFEVLEPLSACLIEFTTRDGYVWVNKNIIHKELSQHFVQVIGKRKNEINSETLRQCRYQQKRSRKWGNILDELKKEFCIEEN